MSRSRSRAARCAPSPPPHLLAARPLDRPLTTPPPYRSLPQIEQWTEHYYPSFISVQAPSAGPAGQASSGFDPTTLDARIRIAEEKKAADAAKALTRSQRKMDRYRASKGLPPKRFDAQDAGSSNADWLILAVVLVALLVVMGLCGLGIAWLVIKVRRLRSRRPARPHR